MYITLLSVRVCSVICAPALTVKSFSRVSVNDPVYIEDCSFRACNIIRFPPHFGPCIVTLSFSIVMVLVAVAFCEVKEVIEDMADGRLTRVLE